MVVNKLNNLSIAEIAAISTDGVIKAKIISPRNETFAYMGDTLKCAAAGSPPVKFQWIQLATNQTVVGELSSIKVEESAILSYRCLASNVVSGLTYTAWSRPLTICRCNIVLI